MAKDKLQDGFRGFIVPVDIFDVQDIDWKEQMVYIVLRSFANPREATAFPSYNTIARLGRMSRRSAIRAVEGLVNKGLIKKEIRLDVSKNRKIRNTSNLYKINNPEAVTESHRPSVTESPSLVTESHRPSVTESPEHNQLTKQIRTKQINNNKKTSLSKKDKIVVDDRSISIQSLLKDYGLTVSDATLIRWKKKASYKIILQVIEETIQREGVKNPIGYITQILEDGYSSFQYKSNKRNDLPEYIVNQIQYKQDKPSATITIDQQLEALDLLLELKEIDEKEYTKRRSML